MGLPSLCWVKSLGGRETFGPHIVSGCYETVIVFCFTVGHFPHGLAGCVSRASPPAKLTSGLEQSAGKTFNLVAGPPAVCGGPRPAKPVRRNARRVI